VDNIALIFRIVMRQRTSYPKPFKAQIVQECLQPGVSMASVARRHGVNANLAPGVRIVVASPNFPEKADRGRKETVRVVLFT
jgi:hypothetical protein